MDFLTVDRQVSSSSDKKGDESEANEDLEVDNSKSVLLKIATLYAEQLMSDLILEVGGHGYPAHRLILCASSEVFQVMLMNREWSEWRESRIVLQETPTAASVFPHFLKYFYTGQIRISHHTVLPVLSLADKYNVKDLVALCLGYMSQHIAQAAKRAQLISWMQYTMACGHNDVAKECQNFVKWNLEWVWSDSDLSELEGETLVQLLQQSDLVLHNEMSVYRFVVRWLNKQRERLIASDLTEAEFKVHWESLVAAVFSHVRFPMMCPNQLAKLLLCPLTQEHKDFFMERMAIAMSYQSGQYERVSEVQQTEAGRMLFTPRLYTEDTWGSVLAVDNFHSLPCYHTRTFIFSTRPSIADVAPQDKLTEWTVDLYPKGVWFRKSLLIVWAGTYDVPEVVLRTVRISITCQNCPEYTVNQYGETEQLEPDVRVKGSEHRRSPRLRRAEHSAVLTRAGQQRLHARGVAAARARQQQVHALRRFYSQQVLFEVLGDVRRSRTEALVRTQQGSIEDTSSDRAPDGLLPRGRGRQRPGMTSNTSASVSLSSQPVREGDALASLFIWCCTLEVKVQRVSLVQNAPFCECGLFEIALLVLNVRTVQYGSSGV